MAEAPGPTTGTIRRVSPRARDALPPDIATRLAKVKETHDQTVADADDTLRAAVIDALKHGSVRQVASAAGLAPSTVQIWSKGKSR